MRNVEINIIGVGAGASYSLSGPSHFAFEDVVIMNLLGVDVISPSDNSIIKLTYERCFKEGIRYFRLDSNPLPNLDGGRVFKHAGFRFFERDCNSFCITTGFMTHVLLSNTNFSIIDLFLLNNFDEIKLNQLLKNVEKVFIVFECFFEPILSKFLKWNSKIKVVEIENTKVWRTYSRDEIVNFVLREVKND